MFFIGGFFILAGVTADKGGWIVIVFGILAIVAALSKENTAQNNRGLVKGLIYAYP